MKMPLNATNEGLLTLKYRFGSAIVTFRVGSDPSQDFVIHEGVIAPGSEFVRLALRGDWKEAKERIIQLPKDDAETFAVYQQWLYTGSIRTSADDFQPGIFDEYRLLVQAFILGEKFVDVNFKDCITDAIIEKLISQERFSLYLTVDVYYDTPPNSPLRRLLMDVYYWTGCAEWLDEDELIIEPGFMADFSRFQMRQRQSSASSPILIPCNYHQHEKGRCYRKNASMTN